MVEHMHHRHQLAETREALRAERDHNRKSFADDVDEYRRQIAAMINNLIVLHYLQQHPKTPVEKLPGILVWHAYRPTYADAAWKTAQQGNVTALMPPDEARATDVLYELLMEFNTAYDKVFPAVLRGRMYAVTDPDPTHLSPSQVTEAIGYAEEVLIRQVTTAAEMVRITSEEPDFGPGLTAAELTKQLRTTEMEGNPALAAAVAITNSRLPARAQLPIPTPGAKP